MYLVLEISEMEAWPAALTYGSPDPRCIPAHRRPTVLQPDRATAEREALRLQRAHPGASFAVFKATATSAMRSVPTHLTLDGRVVASQNVPVLIDEPAAAGDQPPF